MAKAWPTHVLRWLASHNDTFSDCVVELEKSETSAERRRELINNRDGIIDNGFAILIQQKKELQFYTNV